VAAGVVGEGDEVAAGVVGAEVELVGEEVVVVGGEMVGEVVEVHLAVAAGAGQRVAGAGLGGLGPAVVEGAVVGQGVARAQGAAGALARGQRWRRARQQLQPRAASIRAEVTVHRLMMWQQQEDRCWCLQARCWQYRDRRILR
jgi:hypothetical protein